MTDTGYRQAGYVPEESRKRPLSYENNGSEAKKFNPGGNEPLLKLLVPSYTAGALIGKGGEVMNELRNTYGGNIRISAGKEYYPGTQERVVVLTGEIDQINDLNNHVMGKVQDPGRDGSMKNVNIDSDRGQKVKIVLTNQAAGLLIGRGGATIKGIKEESKANISICMPDKATVPDERVLTMSGSFSERSEACRQIIKILASDSSNMANTKLRYMTGGMDTNVSMGGGYNGSFNSRPQQDTGMSYQGGANKLKATVEIKVEIPNVMVGPILGKQGSIIKDFVHRSGGARFKFSDKTEKEEENRTLTISGGLDQAYNAYSLVSERVEQIRNIQPNAQGF